MCKNAQGSLWCETKTQKGIKILLNATVKVNKACEDKTEQSITAVMRQHVMQLTTLIQDMLQCVIAWNQSVSPEGRIDMAVLATLERILSEQTNQVVIISHRTDENRLLAQLIQLFGYENLFFPEGIAPLKTRVLFHDITSYQMLLAIYKLDQTEQIIDLSQETRAEQIKKIQWLISEPACEIVLEIILPQQLDFSCYFLELPVSFLEKKNHQEIDWSWIHASCLLLIESTDMASEMTQAWLSHLGEAGDVPVIHITYEMLKKQAALSEHILPTVRQHCLNRQRQWMRKTCQQLQALQTGIFPVWEKYAQQMTAQLEEYKFRYTTMLNDITFKKTVLSRERAVQEHRIKIESDYFSKFYTQEVKNKIVQPLRVFRADVIRIVQQDHAFSWIEKEDMICLTEKWQNIFHEKIKMIQEVWEAIKFDMKQQLKSWHVSFSNVDFKQMATLEEVLETWVLPFEIEEKLSPWCMPLGKLDENHLEQIQNQAHNLRSKISHFETLTAKTESELFALQHRLDLNRQRLSQMQMQLTHYQQPVFLRREKTIPLFGAPTLIEKDLSPFAPIFQRQAWDEEKRHLEKTCTEYSHAIQHLETKITWLMEMKHIHAVTKREYERQFSYLDEEYQKKIQQADQRKEQLIQHVLLTLKTHLVQLLTTQIEYIEQKQTDLILDFYHQYSDKLIAIMAQTYFMMENSLEKQLIQMRQHYETLLEAQQETKSAMLVEHFPKMKMCLRQIEALEETIKQAYGEAEKYKVSY